MNEHDFEDKLHALTARLARPDPTPGWKAEILKRARHAREQAVPRAPRWLLATLSVAWLLIAVLRFTTPDDTAIAGVVHGSTTTASSGDAPLRALMAFHSHPELLELP